MRAKFYRHEYTWSKHTIGGTVGLGIVSSSIPKEKDTLRELEKLASMAEADSETGTEVELLMYHADLGMVKMAVLPAPAAEDQRKNKKVYLYQCEDMTKDPAVYCLPGGSWESQKGTYLSPEEYEEDWEAGRNILMKYQLMDRLPDVFRAVFWCVFRGGQNLSFVADWNREEYGICSREIMYALHTLLPASARKNAGYASFGCGMNQCCAFSFTDVAPEGDYFDISSLKYHRKNMREDRLEEFFYETLARIYWENEVIYQEYIAWVEAAIDQRELNKNVLKEMQWMFLQFCLEHQMDIPPSKEILSLLPLLFYGAKDSELLSEIQENLLYYYHAEDWSREKCVAYLGTLEHGMTKKGEQKILEEMEWTLREYQKQHRGMVKDYLQNLQKNNNLLYTKLFCRNFEEDGTFFQETFEESKGTLEQMKQRIEQLTAAAFTDAIKDAWMLRGIEILNEDVFCVEHFKTFTEIATIFQRKKQWADILEGFLTQLRKECENLTDQQLDAACEIEILYGQVVEEPEKPELAKEKEKKTAEAKPSEHEKKKTEKGERMEEVYREIERKESETFVSFFVSGIPYGFLTGCILFLLHYALSIGHWKISIGVGGMWLILMMNYGKERLQVLEGFRSWKAIGLCIVEGFIIKSIAWSFLPQEIRVYFFLALGGITVLIQGIHIICLHRARMSKKEERA